MQRVVQKSVLVARRCFHRAFGDRLPVTYSTEEFLARRVGLGARTITSDAEARSEVTRRLFDLVPVLEQPLETLAQYVKEGSSIELADETPCDRPPLPSPMSRHDRYVLFVVVRSLHPRKAVETGVANGCSSAMILAAMEHNGTGELIGLDNLLAERDRLGQRIPTQLRARFTFRLADSIAELRNMIQAGQTIDLFLHDSLHTYRHARTEYELAWKLLAPGGALCSHDILYNNAFDRFVAAHGSEISGFAKLVNFGITRKKC